MKRKTRNILLISVAAFLTLSIATGIYLYRKLPAYFTKKLESEFTRVINSNHENLYIVEIADVTLSPAMRELRIPYIYIIPREEILSHSKAEELPAQIFRIAFKNVAIGTGGLVDLALNKQKIDFSHIYLKEGTLSIITNKNSSLPETTTANVPETFSIGKFKTDLLMFEQALLQDSAAKLIKIDSIMLEASITWNKPSDLPLNQFIISNFSLHTQKIAITPAEDLYNYEIGQTRLSCADSTLVLKDLRLFPIYDKQQLSQHMAHQANIANTYLKSVTVSTIDINQILNGKTFRTKKISIADGKVNIFRDKNLPLDTLRRPLMPVKLIRTASIPFEITSTEIMAVDLIYSELPANKTEEVIVPLLGIEGTIQNITNIESNLQTDSTMQISASTKLFSEALLEARFAYNLMDINGGYQASGTLTSLDFKTINPILKPLLNVEVEEGYHEKNQFSFSGNDFFTAGEITMQYNNLKLVEAGRSKLRKAFVGWVGRNYVYYPSNPENNNTLRIGIVEFHRDPSRFVFHYWWHSYLSGIKSSVIRENVDI